MLRLQVQYGTQKNARLYASLEICKAVGILFFFSSRRRHTRYWRDWSSDVCSSDLSLNGNGEMTGTTWVEESGFLEGPVMITNTHSVGVVRDAVIQWRVAHGQPDPTGYWWSLPVVAETWDGWLNDINGFHVKPEHAFHAIDSAKSGPVEE